MTTLTAATPTMTGALAPLTSARPGPAPSAGWSGADFLRIVRQRAVLIAVLWSVSTGLTAVGTWSVVKFDPRFQASALVQVKSPEPVNLLNPLEERRANQQDVEVLVMNEVSILDSPEVLSKVFEEPEIKRTDFYRWTQTKKNDDPIDLLDTKISAVPVKNSNFIKVTATCWIPDEAAKLANTLVDKYLEKRTAMQKEGINQTTEQLDRELKNAEDAYQRKRTELADFQSRSGVPGIPQPGPSENVLTLQALVTELGIDAIARQTQYDNLINANPEDLPVTAELQAMLQTDPLIVNLERGAQDAETAMNQIESRGYGKNHPMAKTARATRDSLEKAAAEERAAKLLDYQKQQIEVAHRSFLESKDQLLKLSDKLNAAQMDQLDRDQKYFQYLRLTEEKDQLQKQYEQLNENRNIMVMMTKPLARLVQIEVSRAVAPKVRHSPKWLVWLPAGMTLGLFASLGIAMLLELADKSVRTPRDVPRVPVLGIIPTADDDEVEIERVETASIDVPHSIVAEAFRSLRANLFFSAPAEQQGVILVTSPSGGNGKTTIAGNLAIAIALSGRRVLLIDANFRRPALPRLFESTRREGLSNLLVGQGRLADLAASTNVPGLEVLGSGPTPPNPAELLGSSYLRDVVADARSQYDQVIFDGPPVLLVSDAMVLAGAVDGVLVVCQYRSTSRGAFQRTQAQLEAINARVFGAVLNRVETRAGGYFRKAYREFYAYQESEEGAGIALPQLAPPGGEEPAPPKAERAFEPPPSPGAGSKPANGSNKGAPKKPEPPRAASPAAAVGDKNPGLVDADRPNAGSTDPVDDLDIDLDLKIDDNFDLGEDLDEPDQPPRDGGRPEA